MKKKKSLIGWAVLRKNYSNRKWDLVKMLNPEGSWALFYNEDAAKLTKFMGNALTGGAIKDKIVKVRINIEHL